MSASIGGHKMPDISMCKGRTKDGIECQIKDRCYRYLSMPSMIQTYIEPGKNFDKEKGCYLFMDIGEDCL